MSPKEDPVRLGLSNPQDLTSLTLRDWDLFIRLGRKAAVLGRIHALLDETGLLEQIPSAPRAHLEAARVVALDQGFEFRNRSQHAQAIFAAVAAIAAFALALVCGLCWFLAPGYSPTWRGISSNDNLAIFVLLLIASLARDAMATRPGENADAC